MKCFTVTLTLDRRDDSLWPIAKPFTNGEAPPGRRCGSFRNEEGQGNDVNFNGVVVTDAQELALVFITIMVSLGLMVIFGRWWES